MHLVTIKCPKCGHSQEERQDCVRCGIVFAKYYAMYPQGRDVSSDGHEPMVSSYAVSPDVLSAEVSELRQGVREIASRLSDVEFERAERNLLRGEVKTVEQKLTEIAEELRNRLVALESRPAEPDPELIPQPFSGAELDDMAERLGQMEEQIEGVAAQIRQQDPATEETIRDLATRHDGLESRVEKWIAELQESRDAGRASDQGLEDLRQAVQSATVRYSEIGDLKKNHLVLQNEIETLHREQEALRNQPANGKDARITQLESEVTALRAELRQTLKRLESMESGFEAQLQGLRSCTQGSPLDERTSSALAQIHESLKAEKAAQGQKNDFFSSELRRFEDWNQSMSTGLQETSDRLTESRGSIETLIGDVQALKEELVQMHSQLRSLQDSSREAGRSCAPDKADPAAGDLHDIKAGLDQIRLFMQDLAQKL